MACKGLNDTIVAGRMDVSTTTINRWRRHERQVGDHQKPALAAALDVDRWELLYQLPPKGGQLPSVDRVLEGADPEIHRQVLDLATFLVKRAS